MGITHDRWNVQKIARDLLNEKREPAELILLRDRLVLMPATTKASFLRKEGSNLRSEILDALVPITLISTSAHNEMWQNFLDTLREKSVPMYSMISNLVKAWMIEGDNLVLYVSKEHFTSLIQRRDDQLSKLWESTHGQHLNIAVRVLELTKD